MNALLLSAGLGTRFKPITDRIAKPAIPFLNVPLMAYSLYYLEKLKLKNLVLNTHHLPKNVESVTSCLTHEQNYKISFSHEPKILGSGGGIKQAQHLLNARDNFIVCNADEVMLFNHDKGFAPLLEFHKSQNALATLLTTNHPQAGKTLGGVWSDANGKINKLGGTAPEPKAKHFAGVYVFSPRIFDYMPTGEFHIFKDCLHKAMAKNEKVLSFHDPDLTWLDMSSEKDYIASTKSALTLLNKKETKANNLKNILNRFHQNFENTSPRQWLCPGAKFEGKLDESAFLFMGPDSSVGKDVKITGFAVLGAKATFAQGEIENSVLALGAQASSGASHKDQLVF